MRITSRRKEKIPTECKTQEKKEPNYSAIHAPRKVPPELWQMLIEKLDRLTAPRIMEENRNMVATYFGHCRKKLEPFIHV